MGGYLFFTLLFVDKKLSETFFEHRENSQILQNIYMGFLYCI